MFIPAEILGDELATIYPYGIDPHAGHKVGRDGIILEEFEDKIITVDKLLDNIDLALDWYIPSDFAIEFIIFIRLILGEEPENTSPKAHYFFIDCVFQQPNVKPFFMIRNIDYDDLKDRVVILASREFSKALTLDSEIATPTGYRTMQDIQVGDEVIARTGKPTKVIAKSKVFFSPEHNTYKMTTEDGRELLVSRDHEHIIWKRRHSLFPDGKGRKVWRPGGMQEVVMTTEEMLYEGITWFRKITNKQRKGEEYKYYIPRMDKPIEFEPVATPIDPYLVGLILGDGSIDKDTGFVRITSHEDDWKTYEQHIKEPIGNIYRKKGQEHIVFVSIKGIGPSVKEFIGCQTSYTKRIPEILLTGSVSQRISLLQGLMDTDGTINKKGSMSFTTVSKGLAEDVQQLVWTLGGKSSISIRKTNSKFGISYQVTVGLNGVDVFRLERKKCRQTYIPARDYVAIKSLEVVHTQPMQCITVEDPTASYITKNGLVTHNSTLVAYLILYMAAKGKVPGFGKVNYGLYVADSMRNNVETTMTTIKKVYQESKYLKSLFEDTRLIQTEVSFVRKPTTRKEIDAYQQAINVEKLKPEEVPGRMKRTFTLVGIGANTGGRGSRDGLARPDFTIFDDMLPSEAEANSDVILAKVESTIESDILPGMNNNGNFSIMIGTPYSKKDPVYRRIEQGTWLPVVFPRGNKLPTDEKTFISVWEDRHSYKNCRKDYVRAMRAKDAGDGSKLRSLLQEHYLRISSDEDRMITDSMVQWYNRTDVERRLAQYNVYMTTDFTTTGASGSDMSGIAVWALGSNNDIFMLDLCLRRQELEEQYEEVFRMNKYWTKHAAKSITIGIETDGQQKGHVLAVKDRMIRKNEYMTIGKQKGSKPGSEGILSRLEKGNKHWRFRMMLPLFQNKKIYFPRELEDTPDMREMMDQIKYATYAGFGTKCDDGADLISQLGMMDMQFPMSSMYDDDDEYSATDDDDEGYGAPKRAKGSFYKTGYKKEKLSSVYDLYN